MRPADKVWGSGFLSTSQEGTAYLPKSFGAARPQGQRQVGAGDGACSCELNGPGKGKKNHKAAELRGDINRAVRH